MRVRLAVVLLSTLSAWSDFHFGGQIDEVRISSVARYTSDTMILVPEARFVADERTIALWHFDEGSGMRALDASGNGHHGKLQGGARFVDAPCGKH